MRIAPTSQTYKACNTNISDCIKKPNNTTLKPLGADSISFGNSMSNEAASAIYDKITAKMDDLEATHHNLGLFIDDVDQQTEILNEKNSWGLLALQPLLQRQPQVLEIQAYIEKNLIDLNGVLKQINTKMQDIGNDPDATDIYLHYTNKILNSPQARAEWKKAKAAVLKGMSEDEAFEIAKHSLENIPETQSIYNKMWDEIENLPHNKKKLVEFHLALENICDEVNMRVKKYRAELDVTSRNGRLTVFASFFEAPRQEL